MSCRVKERVERFMPRAGKCMMALRIGSELGRNLESGFER